MQRRIARSLAAAVAIYAAGMPSAAGMSPERERELTRLVRQDCGSCHGMSLRGGLGPALLPGSLADKPLESLAFTVMQGRPGTAMPGWRAFLSEAEARWIVERLAGGFPEESR